MKRRALQVLCAFLAIYLINFFLPRLMPGDSFSYTSAASGEGLDVGYSAEQLASLRSYYQLDRPLGEQLVSSTARALVGDLGQSIHYKAPVTEVLGERLGWSLFLVFGSLSLALAIGSLLALWSVRNSRAERLCYPIFSVLGEIPAFLIAVLLLFLVATKVSWIPLSGGLTPFARYHGWGDYLLDFFLHALLPLTAMTLVNLSSFYFTARACFLSELQKPYLLGAKSKGLNEGRIRWQYLFYNSVSALIARFFLGVSSAMGATLLVENVFAYPGIGRVLRESVAFRDFPMMQGVFLTASLLVLGSLLVADWMNSRIGGAKE